MRELAQNLGLDLADALAGYRELPTSSSVWSVFMPMPKRMRKTGLPRGVSDASTRLVVSSFAACRLHCWSEWVIVAPVSSCQ